MWGLCLSLVSFFALPTLSAQDSIAFSLRLEEVVVPGMPGLQSYVAAQWQGEWLLIAGRTDGLHRRRPFEAFLASDNNQLVYVVDPEQAQVWSASLIGLPPSYYEQLQATNLGFEQRDSVLYLLGGYGYSATAGDHVTHPYLTAVNIPGMIAAVKAGTSLLPHLRQLQDDRMAVTGGYLDRLDSTFFLVCGQRFTGRYNPMGPTHGPGFVQQYTEEIRRFGITDDGTTLSLSGYTGWRDSAHLHRRDYNMAPQIFPDGTPGFTIFSGVFQHNVDLPWLNTIDITADTYRVVPAFDQYLSQYHSAHATLYDATEGQMHTLFFGGMSRYTLDSNGNLQDDPAVPFVRTVSLITRYGPDSLQEYRLPVEMPGYLGSGAEFFPAETTPRQEALDIIYLDSLEETETLIGYIFGGIESTGPNVFFSNDPTVSDASSRVFRVYLTPNSPSSTGLAHPIDGHTYFQAQLAPNPARDLVQIRFQLPRSDAVQVRLTDIQGRERRHTSLGTLPRGSHTHPLSLQDLPAGTYLLQLTNGHLRSWHRLVKE
ncbi:MAG: T9SS C-terminal target domain-containing protein [Bacteroidetes bacterium]|nr:MAG: T9SS C-terminal target domain-containing protein [Bacteroidota bacterium]